MKRIVLILALLVSVPMIHAQDFELNISGYIGMAGSSCGSPGIQSITYIYDDNGREKIDFNYDDFYNRNYKRKKIFSPKRKIVAIEFVSKKNRKPLGGSCKTAGKARTKVIKVWHCINKRYENVPKDDIEEVYHPHFKGHVDVSITPVIELSFKEGNNVKDPYNTCKGGAVNINATTGFGVGNGIYNWEFFDIVDKREIEHHKIREARAALEQARKGLEECVENGDATECVLRYQPILERLVDVVMNFTPRTELADFGWRPIPNTSKIGKSEIALVLSDLYLNAADRDKVISKPLKVRINTGCTIGVLGGEQVLSNILTVVYMPDLPKMTSVNNKKSTTCAGSEDGEFTITFDRPLKNGEVMNLALEIKKPLGNFDIHENKTFRIVGDKSFVWKGVKKGDYRVNVTGGTIDGKDVANCDYKTTKEFTIGSPPEIEFTAEGTDETCYGKKDGKIEIKVTKGGTGSYQYSLNDGTWTAFTYPNAVISNLSPNNTTGHKVKIRRNDKCETSAKSVKIKAATQIVHTGVVITPPGEPDAEDASIHLKKVEGGTPKTDGMGSYYDATIYIKGSDTNTKSQKAHTSGFDIDGLPAGEHVIEYTDAIGCIQRHTFTAIEDPLPITFEINKTDPSCSDATDGTLEVTNIKGGYPDYTISWKKDGNPYRTGASITGGKGNYEVEITDQRSGKAEQSGIQFDNIPFPVAITDIDVQPILCNGDKAKVTITATGGSGAYQYAVWTGITTTVWQDSPVFALEANTMTGYRFRVRDSKADDCNSEIQPDKGITINQPDAINIKTVNLVHNNIFGDNKGAIEISVAEGKPGYTIAWEKDGASVANTGVSVSGLKAGKYVAVVRDGNGCEVRSSVIEVEQPDQLIAEIKETPPVPCYKGSGTLTAEVKGGSLSYTYQWYKDGESIKGQEANTLSDVKAGNYSVHVKDGYTSTDAAIKFEEPKELILTIAKRENVSCFSGNDGKIITSPQGGTPPYYFSIDDKKTYISEDDLTDFTIEGLKAISYTIWLKDANGCEISTPQTVTLTSPDEIIVTAKSIVHATTVNGTNGSITLDDVIGGVGTYTYSWSKEKDADFSKTTRDIDHLSHGIYTVSVTDGNACIVEKTFEVKEPNPMHVKIKIETPVLCHDDALGELLAVVSGGYPIESTPADFEYRWYKVESGRDVPVNTDYTLDRLEKLKAGKYKVVTRDSQGVTAETTIDLTQPEDLVVKLERASTKILCYGELTGAIDITVTGGPKNPKTGDYLPYTYKWTNTEDPDFEANTEDLKNMPAGTYEVVIIDDNLCTVSLSEAITIKQPDAALEIYDVKAVNLTSFKAGDGSISLEVKGGTTPYDYVWKNLDDPKFSASGEDINALQIGRYELVVTDANACSVSITQEIIEPNQLIVNIIPLSAEEQVQCYGENTVVPLSATTQGGIGDYTYQWYEEKDPTAILFTAPQTTVVGAGIYTVVVTDANGNTHRDTYTVEEPEAIDIEQDVVQLSCRGDADGSIDITIKGGVQPYSYRWSTGQNSEDLSSLQAGNYTVTVTDANNCTITQTIKIDQPPALFVDGDIIRVNPSVAGARDGSITVNMAGGTPPYHYEWRDFGNVLQSAVTNVLNNIGSEKYSLTITDVNGCSLHIPDVDLYDPPVLKIVIKQVNVVLCNGNATASLNARVQGGTPFNATKQYTYQWFDADKSSVVGSDNFLLEGVTSGNYYVVVTDAADTRVTSAVFSLTEPKELGLKLDTDYKNCGDGEDWVITAQVEGGTAPYTYLWNTGDTGNRLENVIGGTYSVEITDKLGCYVTNQVVTTAPVTLDVHHSQTNPTCYEGYDGTILLEVLGGAAPYSYQWSNGQTGKDLTNICAGTYSVTITDVKGCQITREYVLDNPEALLVDAGEDVTLCNEQSIVLDATITDPDATYFWTSENGYNSTDAVIDVSEPGIYKVVVTNSIGCIGSDSVFVDSSAEDITANFFASTQVFVGEEFVIVDNSEPIPDNVDWIFPEEAIVIHEDDDYAEAVFETPGEYEITLKTYRGLCTTTITKTIIVVEKEIENEGEEEELDIQSYIDYLVYPNPTFNGSFKVEVDLQKSQPISVKIFNMINNTLIDSKSGEGNSAYIFDYDMSLPSGIYFVLLETSSASQVRKLIIE
jgi:hypothetical protein